MKDVFKIRLVLTPDPSGGLTVTSPDVPELVTEGDTATEALENVPDALEVARELYADLGKTFPGALRPASLGQPVTFETLVEAA